MFGPFSVSEFPSSARKPVGFLFPARIVKSKLLVKECIDPFSRQETGTNQFCGLKPDAVHRQRKMSEMLESLAESLRDISNVRIMLLAYIIKII